MGSKSTTRTRGGYARWVLLGGLALLAGTGYLVFQQARVFATRSLDQAFPNTDATIGRTWFDAQGNVVATKITVYLGEQTLAGDTADSEPSANTLRFERMVVRAPGGWMFWLRNIADRSLANAALDDWHMAFEGFDTRAGVEPSFGTLGPVGALSASPFESEGCSRHAYFLRTELDAMGLVGNRTSYEVALREDSNRVSTTLVLATPGVSRVEYRREETLATPTSLLQLDKAATSTLSEHWDVTDAGFVRARNGFCARQDGVDEATFVARHVSSVQRLLETRGLVVDGQTVAAYRHFARNGGHMAFGGPYATPIHSSERAQARRNGSAFLRMAATYEHGSARGSVAWSGTTPRALDRAGGATFAAMTKENGGTAPSVGSVSSPDSAIPASPVAAEVVSAPQPQYASSLPSAAPALAPGGRLSWDELPAMQGRVLQVFTMHNEPRTATLISADANEALVRARVSGGSADYRISREAFLRARLIQ